MISIPSMWSVWKILNKILPVQTICRTHRIYKVLNDKKNVEKKQP